MVSLPHIFQEEGNFSGNDYSSVKSGSNISNLFCNNCSQDLALSVRKVHPRIIEEYGEKCAQIRNMQRLLCQEETTIGEIKESPQTFGANDRTFQISNVTRETLQIYSFGFPFIRKSELLSRPLNEFNWEHLNEKLLKRRSRCQMLHQTSKFEHKEVKTKNVRKRVKKLPSIEYQELGKGHYYGDNKPETCPQTLLSADPAEVVFDGFEVGGCYKIKCKITNVSSEKCRFHILPLPKDSQFKVYYSKNTTFLAPGLHIYVTIKFFCRYLADTEDSLVIKTGNGKDLVVTIKAESFPPCLVEVNDKASNITEVVDSLVDCGSHFVAEKGKTTLTLKNIGSAARFCFVTESEWASLEFSIDQSNIVEADPFTITPKYFQLKESQVITLCVTATPPSNGLHTVRVLLLCDNGTLNRIDLVCDGLLFEPCLIEHSGMVKNFDVDIQDSELAECYIDFGEMLTGQVIYNCFALFNTVNVGMNYHWELREALLPGTEPLPSSVIRITSLGDAEGLETMSDNFVPGSDRFAPLSSEMFIVRVDTKSITPGVYRAMLVLVVDDLPEKCIPLNYCRNLLNLDDERDEKSRSIDAKFIEVWLECVSPHISLSPYMIDFSDFPLTYGSPIEIREINVKNESPGGLHITWECYEECPSVRIAITPSRLYCDKCSTRVCTLSIQALQEGYFESSFWCVSDKGDAKVELLVKGYCCKPRLTALTDHIDFGLVRVGSQQTNALIAKNCSLSDSFQWTLDELHFRTREEGLVKITDAPSGLSTSGGEVCHKNSEVLVNYQMNFQEDSLWCSVVEWDGTFIPVTADIQSPDISLSKYALFADPLYLGVLNRMRVGITNHSLVSAALCWGCPTDRSLETIVTVEAKPRSNVLKPGEQTTTEIILTPHAVGPLENLYLPCFVEGNHQPLLLKIEGNVEGLRIRVEWDSETQHCCVSWPPYEYGVTRETIDLSEKMCICPPNSLTFSETASNAITSCDILSIDSNFSLTLNSVREEPPNTEECIDDTCSKEVMSEECQEKDDISLASSIPYLNWPIVGGRYTRDPMDAEWERHFNNLFILEEIGREVNTENPHDLNLGKKSLSFSDIPLRKAITQNIFIRNDTAIPSCFEATAVYNFERDQKQEKFLDVEKYMKKMRARDYDDEFEERASPHRGLTVFVTPEKGHLAPNDYVILSVTVVAHSWGQYSDIIMLQIGELDHLCVPLTVTVSKPPIIAPELIRFGSLALSGPAEFRRFELENISSVPVYISWQIFTTTSDPLPFSAMLFDDNPFELRLTDYYGSHSPPLFQIMENYIHMEKNSSKTIEVSFDPQLVNIDNGTKFDNKLKSVLVGHIYLTKEARIDAEVENCKRVDGHQLSPLLINLEAALEVPLLSLLNVFNYQLSFNCTAYDVMSANGKKWMSESVITVQNNSRTDIKAKVYAVGYFYVTKIEYSCSKEEETHSKTYIYLRPGETCDVTIVCKVTESNLLDCFDPDVENVDDEPLELCSVERGLLCFEQQEVRQDVKLDLHLYPPLLQFSEASLNFGTVYVEDKKMLIFNITAPLNEESFEASIKHNVNGPFSISATYGVLKPKTGYLLQVFFSPKECTYYQDVLVVRACLDKMAREIPLTGIGTFDYRAHTY